MPISLLWPVHDAGRRANGLGLEEAGGAAATKLAPWQCLCHEGPYIYILMYIYTLIDTYTNSKTNTHKYTNTSRILIVNRSTVTNTHFYAICIITHIQM